ncbi:MAG: hypothetical protein ACOY40_12700 [Bacillota bacterium]
MAKILYYARKAWEGEIGDIKQASRIFLDACFILRFFEEHEDCVELMDQITDQNCTLFISSTVFGEVTNVLLRSSLVVDGYYYHTRDSRKILSHYAAQIIEKEFDHQDIQNIRMGYHSRVKVDTERILKMNLVTEKGRKQFRVYFEKVAEQVGEFIKEYSIRFIEQDMNICRETEKIMASDLLSPNDANHYACYLLGPLDEKGNRTGPLDFLLTLDGDFERATDKGQVIKIAS